MKKFLLAAMFIFSASAVMAQYNFAVGLRSGGSSGITLKKNNGSSALEGIVGFWNDGLSLTVLWEKQRTAFNEPGFNWFYGLGGHVSFYGHDFDDKTGPYWYDHPYHENDDAIGLGVDGVVGLEYKIPNVPIAFDINFKPYVEVVTGGGVLFSPDPGIGIKIAF